MNETFPDDILFTPDFFQNRKVFETVILCLSIGGMVKNIFNFLIFSSKEMKSGRSFLLRILSISDMIYSATKIIRGVIYFSLPTITEYMYVFSVVWANGLFLVEGITFLLSEWITLFVGIWRFIVVTWPLKAKVWCTAKNAKITSVLLTVFVILICLPNLACLKVVNVTLHGHNFTEMVIPSFQGIAFIMLFRVWMPILCTVYLLPILSLLIITCLIIQRIRINLQLGRRLSETVDERRFNTDNITIMLIMIMVCYIMTNVPMILLYVSFYVPVYVLRKYSGYFECLSAVDKTTTFTIYLLMSRKFRKQFKNIVFLPISILRS